MNGYFQLDLKPNGTFLNIYLPTDGGKDIDINELADYLKKKKIEFDIVSLSRSLNSFTKNGVIKIDSVSRYQEGEMLTCKISPDRMSALVRFYPPSVDGYLLDRRDIMLVLEQAGVKYGIKEDVLDAFIENRQYLTDFVIAEGKEVRHGSDASIEYFFNTDLRAKPTLKEDGSVDFFKLNTINHIEEGDLLARLTPEDRGEPGVDVTGQLVKPRDVKHLSLKYGRNVKLSDDKLEVFSEVNGHVSLIEGKIFVSNVFTVQNVDNSVGNIEYDGSVKVEGNVCTNFSVKAKGDVEVDGLVEGAQIEAGGNVIIVRGVNGMGKGNIKAGGNVIVKFIENAKVYAGGYVETDSIMHSVVSANTDINVLSKKGFIAGSHVNAGECVNVKNLGSQMGADTVVELGVLPETIEEIKLIKKRIAENGKLLKQLKPVLASYTEKLKSGAKFTSDQAQNLRDVTEQYAKCSEQFEIDADRLIDLEDSMTTSKNARAKVFGDVYSGTKLIFGDLSMVVKNDCSYCQFYVINGNVKCAALD